MAESAVAQRVARAHLAFTLAVQHALSPDPTVTACWSPFSVASALGLAATGARGATRAELVSVLLGDGDGDGCEDDSDGGNWGALATMLTEATRLGEDRGQPRTGEPAVLGVSNTLWAREDVPIHAAFAEELLAWPNAAIRDAAFGADPEGARRLINDDVAETTRGLIPELVPPSAIGRQTVAALVNALYLKVGWLHRFAAQATASRIFHAPGCDVDAPTMRLSARLGYAAVSGWQVVVLPANNAVEAVVLLPEQPLTVAEPRLDPQRLAAVLDAPRQLPVELHLPRFRVTAQAALTGALADLGVRTMFTPRADFGGITDEPLLVSAALHQAVLTVDEQGLEGAAATALIMRVAAVSRPEPPTVVRVDRPFLFLVRHRASGAVYFLARVVDPSAGGEHSGGPATF